MMSHSDNPSDDSEERRSNSDQEDKNLDFGSLLADARKTKNYTTDEISEYIKIPVSTIAAIETNDIEALPAPTFTQGYIRAYAKFLEISDEQVLDIYNRAVPHDDVSDLKPRSNLPGETNSQSPLIKAITVFLIISGVIALGFGGFQYYQEKADDVKSERDSNPENYAGESLDSAGGERLVIEQRARLIDDELILDEPASSKYIDEFSSKENSALDDATASVEIEKVTIESKPEDKKVTSENITQETTRDTARSTAQTNNPPQVTPARSGTFADAIAESAENSAENQSELAAEKDIVEIFAENGSWVQVRDANNSRLLYNMLPIGGSKVLLGSAPFSISMGNAKTTRVVINDLEVDVTNYIRANNTARFKISTQGKNVIFH